MNTGKVFMSIVVAATVGAVAGMLLAPEKGTDVRQKLTDAAADFVDDFLKALSAGRDEVSRLKGKAEEKVSSLKKEGENLKNKAEKEFNHMQNIVKEEI